MQQYVQTTDIGVRGLTEKVTGLDLHPEGVLEKAASWVGFIKNPAKIKELTKIGLKPTELLKAISPSFTEVTRGLGAGTALQMAEEGNFGPAGTLAAAVVGDIIGHAPKATAKAIIQPRKTLAQVTSLFTGANSKKKWIQELVDDANKAGIQLDAGTLANSNIIRMAQARAAQSACQEKPSIISERIFLSRSSNNMKA